MYEFPPILRGSEQEQLAAIRDYLVRLSSSLDDQVSRTIETEVDKSVGRTLSLKEKNGVSSADERSNMLQGLIVKTADRIQHNIDVLTQTMEEDYLAVSDFGSYRETVVSTIESTARGVVESYDFQSALDHLSSLTGDNASYLNSIRGEIRRGFITDPDTQQTVMGIAIAENLRFTGAEQTEGGLTYYELSPGQTLGLYTSTGWQFWINGSKRGWFDSVDGMLHVIQVAIEQSLTIGAGWLITSTGGFGIRYVGG